MYHFFLQEIKSHFYKADINDPHQFIHADKKFNYAILTLLEPPVEKDNSFKACARVNFLCDSSTLKETCGKCNRLPSKGFVLTVTSIR
jgi:hypothetical protein